MGIKNNNKKNKVNSQKISSNTSNCSVNPMFSFQYLTTNKKYNLEKLDKNQKATFLADLSARLIEISQKPWIYWNNLPKDKGMETIPFKDINFSPNGLELSKDEKIIVFRFSSQNARILGVKSSSCAVYNIIGFDTDFSAYNHGN